MAIMLAGRLAPLRPQAEEEVFAGRIWIGDDGLVAAVAKSGQRPPAGAKADRHIDVGQAFIYPGLIDLHSHLSYNTLPLWVEPTQKTAYLHHDIWPKEASYAGQISWPAWTLLSRAPESVLAYVQVRALAGGTTTIQGWPNASRKASNELVRSVDDDKVGPLNDPVMVSALTQDVGALGARAAGLAKGKLFIYHCAEGQRGSIVVREFENLRIAGCLQPGLAAIHCCALADSDFGQWSHASGDGNHMAGSVVWSPFSNLWLYGSTTDVASVRSHQLAVCLGSDWGPSGTKSVLGEIKVARLWSDRQGWNLTDHDLALMVTATPGDTIARAWQRPLGRLIAGAFGDAVVIAARKTDAWANLVAARESDVMLVVVGGRARFGNKDLMRAAGESLTTSVPIGKAVRHVALRRPDDGTKAWAWTDVVKRLNAVRHEAAVTPPVGAQGRRAARRVLTSAMAGDPPGTPPLVARPDMPGAPGQLAGPPPPGQTVQIPPLDPIYHNSRWLSSIKGRGFHGGALDALREFYR